MWKRVGDLTDNKSEAISFDTSSMHHAFTFEMYQRDVWFDSAKCRLIVLRDISNLIQSE